MALINSDISISVLNFGVLIPEGVKLVWDDAKGHYVNVRRGTTQLKRRRSSGYSVMVPAEFSFFMKEILQNIDAFIVVVKFPSFLLMLLMKSNMKFEIVPSLNITLIVILQCTKWIFRLWTKLNENICILAGQ